MIKLAPSMLSADFSKLGEQFKILEKLKVPYIHIDVMDGLFVPNISFGMPVIKSIRKSSNLIFDVHLMVTEPERYIKEFAQAGSDIINIHFEACKNPLDAIKQINSLGKKSAVTIKPNTDYKDILDLIEYVDMVLVMSVEPGFGGQKFMPESLEKVKAISKYIKERNLNTDIEIDGGINLDNLKDVLSAGANVIVAGSSIFGTGDIEKEVQKFYDIFRNFER